MNENKHNYTCTDYRQEMMLLGLKKRLQDPELTEEEKRGLEEEIRRLEKEINMD